MTARNGNGRGRVPGWPYRTSWTTPEEAEARWRTAWTLRVAVAYLKYAEALLPPAARWRTSLALRVCRWGIAQAEAPLPWRGNEPPGYRDDLEAFSSLGS